MIVVGVVVVVTIIVIVIVVVTMSLPDVALDPFHDQVGDLIAVLFVHQHVTIAEDADLRQLEQCRIAPRRVDAGDEFLAVLECDDIVKEPRWRFEVVTVNDQDRNLGQLGDLLIRENVGFAGARL